MSGKKVCPCCQGTGEIEDGRAKLSYEDVSLILALKEGGAAQKAIAETYGVSESTISRIVNGKYDVLRPMAKPRI